MKQFMSVLRVPVLVVLVVGCAALVGGLAGFVGREYRMTEALRLTSSDPIESYALFKSAEPSLKSPARFMKFAQARGVSETWEARQIHSQLANSRGGAIGFKHEF